MSFQAMAEAVKIKLPAAKKCLLMMLANYADENGCCYPAVATLALDAGLSKRSVQNYLCEFVQMGLLSVRKRLNDSGSTTSNLYVLTLADAPKVKRPRNPNKDGGANPAPQGAADAPRGANGAGGGCKPCTGGVQMVQGTGGANPAPNTINKPITEPVIEPMTPPAHEPVPEAVLESAPEPESETTPVDHPDHAHLFAIDAHGPAQGSQRRFAMHWEWQPSTAFADRCSQLGVVLSQIPADQADELLGEFRSYWADQAAEHSQGQWEHKLANRLRRIATPRPPAGLPAALATPKHRRQVVTAAVMDIRDTDW